MKKSAKSDPLKRLMQMARKDPKFFHDLVFAPKKALSKVTFIDSKTKALLTKINPGVLIGGSISAPCGNDETCSGGTCDQTCGESCGGDTCGGNSCARTCENSCDETIVTHPGARG
jgi:hypothetical protein